MDTWQVEEFGKMSGVTPLTLVFTRTHQELTIGSMHAVIIKERFTARNI